MNGALVAICTFFVFYYLKINILVKYPLVGTRYIHHKNSRGNTTAIPFGLCQ